MKAVKEIEGRTAIPVGVTTNSPLLVRILILLGSICLRQSSPFSPSLLRPNLRPISRPRMRNLRFLLLGSPRSLPFLLFVVMTRSPRISLNARKGPLRGTARPPVLTPLSFLLRAHFVRLTSFGGDSLPLERSIPAQPPPLTGDELLRSLPHPDRSPASFVLGSLLKN